MTGNFYFGWLLYNLICGFLLLNSLRTVKFSQIRFTIGVFSLCFLVLGVFGNAITPDYVPYQKIISDIASTKNPFTHLEDIYIYFIHHIGNNYFLYQLIIYTLQFLFFYCLISYSLKHCKYVFYFMTLFAIIGLMSCVGGRAYLCYIVVLSGIVLLFNHKYIIGLTLLIFSVYLHKIGIVLSILSVIALLTPISFNKSRFMLFLTIIIVVIILLRQIIDIYLGDLIEQLSNIEKTAANYIAKETTPNEGGSLWWKLIGLFKTWFFLAICFRVLYLTNKFAISDKITYLYFKISFFFIGPGIIYLCLGLPDPTIGERLLSASTIPICIIAARLNKFKVYTRLDRNLTIIGLFILLLFNNAFIVGVSHINRI